MPDKETNKVNELWWTNFMEIIANMINPQHLKDEYAKAANNAQKVAENVKD